MWVGGLWFGGDVCWTMENLKMVDCDFGRGVDGKYFVVDCGKGGLMRVV